MPGPRVPGPPVELPPIPGPPVPGSDVPGPDVSGGWEPGPDVPGPLVPGPNVPGPRVHGGWEPGPDVPGPLVSGPDVPGPDAHGGWEPGPDVPSPPVPGPNVPGPQVHGGWEPGPDVPGPLVSGPDVPGPRVHGGWEPGLDVPSPPVPGPNVPGPQVHGGWEPGPDVPGPLVSGPDVPGPRVHGGWEPGPDVPGPPVPGPAVPGPRVPSSQVPDTKLSDPAPQGAQDSVPTPSAPTPRGAQDSAPAPSDPTPQGAQDSAPAPSTPTPQGAQDSVPAPSNNDVGTRSDFDGIHAQGVGGLVTQTRDGLHAQGVGELYREGNVHEGAGLEETAEITFETPDNSDSLSDASQHGPLNTEQALEGPLADYLEYSYAHESPDIAEDVEVNRLAAVAGGHGQTLVDAGLATGQEVKELETANRLQTVLEASTADYSEEKPLDMAAILQQALLDGALSTDDLLVMGLSLKDIIDVKTYVDPVAFEEKQLSILTTKHDSITGELGTLAETRRQSAENLQNGSITLDEHQATLREIELFQAQLDELDVNEEQLGDPNATDKDGKGGPDKWSEDLDEGIKKMSMSDAQTVNSLTLEDVDILYRQDVQVNGPSMANSNRDFRLLNNLTPEALLQLRNQEVQELGEEEAERRFSERTFLMDAGAGSFTEAVSLGKAVTRSYNTADVNTDVLRPAVVAQGDIPSVPLLNYIDDAQQNPELASIAIRYTNGEINAQDVINDIAKINPHQYDNIDGSGLQASENPAGVNLFIAQKYFGAEVTLVTGYTYELFDGTTAWYPIDKQAPATAVLASVTTERVPTTWDILGQTNDGGWDNPTLVLERPDDEYFTEAFEGREEGVSATQFWREHIGDVNKVTENVYNSQPGGWYYTARFTPVLGYAMDWHEMGTTGRVLGGVLEFAIPLGVGYLGAAAVVRSGGTLRKGITQGLTTAAVETVAPPQPIGMFSGVRNIAGTIADIPNRNRISVTNLLNLDNTMKFSTRVGANAPVDQAQAKLITDYLSMESRADPTSSAEVVIDGVKYEIAPGSPLGQIDGRSIQVHAGSNVDHLLGRVESVGIGKTLSAKQTEMLDYLKGIETNLRKTHTSGPIRVNAVSDDGRTWSLDSQGQVIVSDGPEGGTSLATIEDYGDRGVAFQTQAGSQPLTEGSSGDFAINRSSSDFYEEPGYFKEGGGVTQWAFGSGASGTKGDTPTFIVVRDGVTGDAPGQYNVVQIVETARWKGDNARVVVLGDSSNSARFTDEELATLNAGSGNELFNDLWQRGQNIHGTNELNTAPIDLARMDAIMPLQDGLRRIDTPGYRDLVDRGVVIEGNPADWVGTLRPQLLSSAKLWQQGPRATAEVESVAARVDLPDPGGPRGGGGSRVVGDQDVDAASALRVPDAIEDIVTVDTRPEDADVRSFSRLEGGVVGFGLRDQSPDSRYPEDGQEDIGVRYRDAEHERVGPREGNELESASSPEPTRSLEPISSPEPTRSVEPISSPEPTRSVEPASSPEPTRSLEPISSPEPTRSVEPISSPEPTRSVEPISSPEPTRSVEPISSPEPTRSIEPISSPEPTRSVEPISSPEPTRSVEPISSPEPTRSVEPISSPEPTRSIEPISSPEPTRSVEPISSPEPTRSVEPISSPEPTRSVEPISSPEPTRSVEPISSPEPTRSVEPISSPEPTRSVEPISSPEPTRSIEPISSPEPTRSPKPTSSPEPTRGPQPTSSPEPTRSPKPTSSPEPTRSPKPTSSPEPTRSPKPTSSPEPTRSPEPTSSPEPTRSPEIRGPLEPMRSPEPARSPEPTRSPEPARSPKPTRSPEPARSPGPTKKGRGKRISRPAPPTRRQPKPRRSRSLFPRTAAWLDGGEYNVLDFNTGEVVRSTTAPDGFKYRPEARSAVDTYQILRHDRDGPASRVVQIAGKDYIAHQHGVTAHQEGRRRPNLGNLKPPQPPPQRSFPSGQSTVTQESIDHKPRRKR